MSHVITHRDLVVRARAMGRVAGHAPTTGHVGADTASGATATPDKPGVLEEAKTTGSNLISILGWGAAIYFTLVYIAPTFIGAAGKTKKARREYREIDPHVTVQVPRDVYQANMKKREPSRPQYPYGAIHEAQFIDD